MWPSELLMHRRLRAWLPDFTPECLQEVWKRNQPKQGHLIPLLKKGDVVQICEDRGWIIKAQVQEQVAPRSYIVVTEDGIMLSRIMPQVLSTAEQSQPVLTVGCGQTMYCFGDPERESRSQSPARPHSSSNGPSTALTTGLHSHRHFMW